jgi:hypothetical protein
MFALQAHDFVADHISDGPLLRVSTPRRPGLKLDIRCGPRSSDSGRLWFLRKPNGRPLAAADDIAGALVAVKDLTAAQR